MSETSNNQITLDAMTAAGNDGRTGTGREKLLATGGLLGALATSACCIVPLVLFGLGISGAWIGNLTALYPYKPYFVTFTLLFLAGGFYLAYRRPKVACEPGSYCAAPASKRLLKFSLWMSVLLVSAALAFPYAAPYLLDY